jgi:autophagy-related protein 9
VYPGVYPTFRNNFKLDKISVRFSGFTLLFFLLFTAFYIWQLIAYAVGIKRLVNMYNFYTHLLKIPDVSSHTYLDIYL